MTRIAGREFGDVETRLATLTKQVQQLSVVLYELKESLEREKQPVLKVAKLTPVITQSNTKTNGEN